MVGGAAQRVGDGIDQSRGVVHHVGLGRQHQGDDVGLAGAQAHAGAVRPVAKQLGGFAHPPLGFLADVGGVLQRAADGGDGKPGRGGDGLQRRARGSESGRGGDSVMSRGHALPRRPDNVAGRSEIRLRCDSVACRPVFAAAANRIRERRGKTPVRASVIQAVSGGGGIGWPVPGFARIARLTCMNTSGSSAEQAKRLLDRQNYNVIEIGYNVLETQARNGMKLHEELKRPLPCASVALPQRHGDRA